LLSKLCFFPNIQNIYQFLSSSRFSAEKRKNVTLEKKNENGKDNFDPCYIGLENSAEFK